MTGTGSTTFAGPPERRTVENHCSRVGVERCVIARLQLFLHRRVWIRTDGWHSVENALKSVTALCLRCFDGKAAQRSRRWRREL